MTNDYGAGTPYRSQMREAIKAFLPTNNRVDLTNLLNTLVDIAYRHHRAIYLAGNQASADRMVGSSADPAARGDSGAEARAEPSEQPQWTIDGATYSRPPASDLVLVECRLCGGSGQSVTPRVPCLGCKGAGVHRV